MKEKKTKKRLKMVENNPEKSEKQVQKTQKITINYLLRGEFREKRMNMMNIYAIIYRKIDLANRSNSVLLGNYMRRVEFVKGEVAKEVKTMRMRNLQNQLKEIDLWILFVVVDNGIDEIHHGLGCLEHPYSLIEPFVALKEIVRHLMPTAIVFHAQILDVFPVAREA